MNVSIPGHTQAVIDRQFLLSTAWRRWVNDLTKEVARLGGIIVSPTGGSATLSIVGNGWIDVQGTQAAGFVITQRDGLTTTDLPEGTSRYADHTAAEYDFTTDANVVLPLAECRGASMTITDSGTVLTTGRSIELPDAFPLMGFHNATAQTLTLKKNGQTGVTVAAGTRAVIWPGPTDVEKY